MAFKPLLAALLAATAATPAFAAPVPKDQLLKPPADAAHYVVVSGAGKHGDMWRWTLPDGRVAYRHSQALRGWISETDAVVAYGPSGMPVAIEVRGVTPNGDAAETLALKDGKLHWKGSIDEGSAAPTGYYLASGGPGIASSPLVDLLAAAGDKGVDLLPSGHATLTRADTLTIQGPSGPKAVQLAFIRGILPSPVPVWLDDKGRYFADVDEMAVMPEGYESQREAMLAVQEKATAQAVRDVAHRFLAPAAKAPVLFDHVTLFDADKGAFRAHQAVLVKDGRIAAVGPAGSIAAGGAKVVNGMGKTLVPGLWDSHMHLGDDWNLVSNMATGIVNFRSPGSNLDRAVDVRTRRASGDLLVGDGKVSVIVDQKHPLAAQGATIVTSEAEAIAAVRKIKAAGLWGVKFYTSMNPAWIAPAAAEAHKLGLHVHGHVPATMRPWDAVKAGYDEITHINFVMMQAMPKEVVDKANTAARSEGPMKYAKDVDLKSAPMKAFIADLARRKTYVDPTLVVFENDYNNDGGVAAKAYAPYLGILSPVLDRGFKSGGYPLLPGYTRDDYRKSWAKIIELVGDLHKAGVPIVAGTDGWGLEIVRELELYKEAGMTPAQALQTATIVPARMVGAADRTGSIAVGKEADLLLVDGDVEQDLGALRRIETVVSDGYVMDGNALRTAAGWTGRPK